MAESFKDVQDFFEENRTKLIVGIIVVVVITMVHGRLRPRTQIPSEETDLSVFFHKTGK